ncbi:hypothetical protein LCGC14_2112010, partial [marine sediment metagenome]
MNLKTRKILIPVVVIAATAAIVMFIKGNPPQANRFAAPPKAQISVAVSKSLVGNQRAKGTKRTPKQLALIKEVHNTDKFKKDASKR